MQEPHPHRLTPPSALATYTARRGDKILATLRDRRLTLAVRTPLNRHGDNQIATHEDRRIGAHKLGAGRFQHSATKALYNTKKYTTQTQAAAAETLSPLGAFVEQLQAYPADQSLIGAFCASWLFSSTLGRLTLGVTAAPHVVCGLTQRVLTLYALYLGLRPAFG